MDYQDVLKTEQAREFRQNRGAGEDNWKSRLTFCSTFSDAIEKRGKESVPRNYDDQIEPFLNNIIDCAVSERTTLSIQGCRLLGNIPKVLGRDIHPYLDRILPSLIKLCTSSKNVAQKCGANAITSIISNATYNPRLLWHVCQSFEEKFAGPKIYGPGWMQQIMKDYQKSLTDRDFDAIGRAIFLGLEDADATVRTNSRGAYWVYYKADRDGAQNIMDKLNNHAKTALQNDPNNPDKIHHDKKSKAPSRPDSALAQIREQAKKQKKKELAAQQAQKSGSVDDQPIEIHEPRIQKPEKREKPLPPVPVGEPEKQHMSKSASRPTTNKKNNSQEADLKASVASRGLLSAPVRRPRIVATPINGPQTSSQNSRPSSRTGQTRQVKEAQDDSRPTSSSSHKGPSSLSPISSPKVKPTSPPRAKAFHIPDGKENANFYPGAKSKHSPPISRPLQHSPPKRPVSATPKLPAAQEHVVQSHFVESDGATKPSLGHVQVPRLLPSSSEPPFVPTHGHVKSNSADYDLSSARRYVDLAMKHLHQGTLDPLGYRKLKNVIEQHSQTLFVDKSKYDELFGELLAQLHGLDNAASKEDPKPLSQNPNYNRQTILQMIVPLLTCFPQWSHKWLTPTLSAIILYRCTLPIDGTDRRTLNAAQVIDAVVSVAANPLDLIDSVTAALQIGEEAILSQTSSNAMIGPYKPSSTHVPSLNTPMPDMLSGTMNSEASVAQMRRYMQNALKQHTSDLPKTLPLLTEFGLNTLIAILTRAYTERPSSPSKSSSLAQVQRFTLNQQQADDLGLLAAHCLKSYDYVIKRAVVPYCQALYQVMGKNDKAFFKYFEDESEVNLLEYYLAGIRS